MTEIIKGLKKPKPKKTISEKENKNPLKESKSLEKKTTKTGEKSRGMMK